MKTEEGLVIETEGNIARIKAGRHNDCKNCGACPGDSDIIVCAKNQKGAVPGQRVVFEVKGTNAVIGAFIVFVLPLIAVFVGIILGRLIGQVVAGHSVVFEIMGGIIGLIIAIVYVKFFDHYANGSDKSQPSILQIL